jgi:serine/threonine protein kinase
MEGHKYVPSFTHYINLENDMFDISKFKWNWTTLSCLKTKFPYPKFGCIYEQFSKCRLINRGHRSNVYKMINHPYIIKICKTKQPPIYTTTGKIMIQDGEYVKSLLIKHVQHIIQPVYSCVLVGTEDVYELNIYDKWDGDLFNLCIQLMKQNITNFEHDSSKRYSICTISLLHETSLFLLNLLKCLKESNVVHTDIKLENILFKWDRTTSKINLILTDLEGICNYKTTTSWKSGQGTSAYCRPIRDCAYPIYADDAYASYRTILYIVELSKQLSIHQTRDLLHKSYKYSYMFINILCDYILPMLENAENTISCMQMSINILQKTTLYSTLKNNIN